MSEDTFHLLLLPAVVALATSVVASYVARKGRWHFGVIVGFAFGYVLWLVLLFFEFRFFARWY